MGTMLDLLSSTIFGGVLLVIILNANDMAVENSFKYNGDEIVQEMLVSTARLLEGEFRNMGYGVHDTLTTVLYADTSRITFLSKHGTASTVMDTIKYRLGPISELTKTKNEVDRFLYRQVSSGTDDKVGVVTIFKLKYKTISGDTLVTPVASDELSEIHVVELTMEVQNPYAISRRAAEINPGERTALYSSSLWQQTRLASQNSRR
jgi:hypothetical protein